MRRWREPTPSSVGFPGGAGVTDGGGTGGTSGSDPKIECTIDLGGSVYEPPVVEGGRVFVAHDDSLSAVGGRIDGRDGVRHLWETAPVGRFFPMGEVVYVGDGTSTHAIDAGTGESLWSVDGAGPVAADRERVYVGGSGTRCSAVDAADGTREWRHAVGSSPHRLVVVGETAYVVGPGGLTALDATDGSVRWDLDVPGSVGSGLVAGGMAVLASGGAVYAVDASDGSVDWFRDDWNGEPEPIGVAGGRVYVVDGAGDVRALDGETGDPRWRLRVRSVPRSPVFADGLLFVSTLEALYALDPVTGEREWTHSAAQVSRPAVADGSVYLGVGVDEPDGSIEGSLRAFDVDGTERWEYSGVSGVVSTPAVGDRSVFAGTWEGAVLGVDLSETDGNR